jgi:hypothetical protein
MRSRYLIEKYTICCILILSFSFISSQELNFLENQFGEVKSGNSCNSPIECYLEAINLIKVFKEELKNKFDAEKAELQKKFDAEKAELQKKFDLERGKSLSLVGQINFYSVNKLELKDEDLLSGWVSCDGRALSRKDYEELYKVLGDQYGNGDGQNTFNIPDLRGRVIVGSGQGQNLNLYKPGDKGGEENHTISISEIPNHSHRYKDDGTDWWSYQPVFDYSKRKDWFPIIRTNIYNPTFSEGGNLEC